ncbi:hypothetical protein C435_16220 [Haloarcula marismortui ATCC 33799]|uniref:ISH4 transposase n=1 Tax=Haloarcula marismortui ATCC 33799 TaxID=662475 RepID=M0K1L2_9EURY|nr:hypothetical protein C435_16220 [Haloarcula californiae ATCC 33799]
MTCPHCRSADTIKKGTTRKDAQRYRCQDCESIFNDLTGTVFAEHQLTIPEMFHIIRGMEEHTTNEIFQELDRTYKTRLPRILSLTFLVSVRLTKSMSLLARRDSKIRMEVRASADFQKRTRNLRFRQTTRRNTRPSE